MEKDREEIEWKAFEYLHEKKDSEWYWSVGILTLAGIVSAYLFGDPLLVVLVFLLGFTAALFGTRQPKELSFGVSKRGIRADRILYPFQNLYSFWILEKKDEDLLLLKSQKKLATQISIPLGDVDLELLRTFLLKCLREEEDEESVAQRFMDYLGF